MYIFETSQFGFTGEELHLMKDGSPYKKIQFKDISSIDIQKGASSKYQVRMVVFVLLLIVLTMFMIMSGLFTSLPEMETGSNWYQGAQGFGAMATIFLFVISLVIFSIYQVIVNHLTLIVAISDGTTEKLRLKPIKDTNKLIHLIEFFLARFEASKLHFDESAVK